MQCRHCGAVNSSGANFCQACGSSLAPPPGLCLACGALNAETAKFCSNCGAGLSPKPATTVTPAAGPGVTSAQASQPIATPPSDRVVETAPKMGFANPVLAMSGGSRKILMIVLMFLGLFLLLMGLDYSHTGAGKLTLLVAVLCGGAGFYLWVKKP